MRIKLDKCKTVLGAGFFVMHLFSKEMEGYLDELAWGFLRKGMKIHPHRHPQKEVYIFIKGEGTMQVDDEIMPVEEGDMVFIPSKSLHTAWNSNDTDLEFIIVRSRNVGPWIGKIVKSLSIFTSKPHH